MRQEGAETESDQEGHCPHHRNASQMCLGGVGEEDGEGGEESRRWSSGDLLNVPKRKSASNLPCLERAWSHYSINTFGSFLLCFTAQQSKKQQPWSKKGSGKGLGELPRISTYTSISYLSPGLTKSVESSLSFEE